MVQLLPSGQGSARQGQEGSAPPLRQGVACLVAVCAVAASILGAAPVAAQQDGLGSPDKIVYDEVQGNLAISQPQTLQDDLAIRITNEGLAFLSTTLQVLLNGWVKQARYESGEPTVPVAQFQADTANTLKAFLGGLTVGYKAGFSLTGVNGCFMFYNANDDDGDNDACDCGVHEGDDPPGDWNSQSCNNCVPGATAWDAGSAPKNQHPTPSSNIGRCPWTGGSPDGASTYRAVMRDPSNPSDDTIYYYCKGPFYDLPLDWDTVHVDPDCYKQQATDNNTWVTSGGDCPNVGTGATCDGICDSWTQSLNDVRVGLTNNSSQQRLDLDLRLRPFEVDGALWVELLGGCDCCFLEREDGGNGWPGQSAGSRDGSILVIDGDRFTARAVGYVQFVNGYYSMVGREGDPYSGGGSSGSGSGGSSGGGGGSSSSGGKGSCSTSSSSSSGGSGSGGSSGSPVLNNHPLVGIEVVVPDGAVSLLNDSGASGTMDVNAGFSGPCYDQGWLCDIGCAIQNTIIDWISDLLEGLVEGVFRDLIAGEVEPLLEEQLGLPVDFTMLLAGQDALAADVCALRLDPGVSGGPPVPHAWPGPLAECDHDASTCPCDDADGDLTLNYMDTTPGVTPTGCPFNTWCGVWNDPSDFRYYEASMWGLGNSIGGVEGSEAPFFEIGAYADDQWDSAGVNIVLDAAIAPFKGSVVGYNFATEWSQRTCFPQANVFRDSTQYHDDNLTTRNQSTATLADINAIMQYFQTAPAYVDPVLGNNQYEILASQQVIQEFFNAMYQSGLLCIVVNAQNFDFLADILKVSSFKAFVPALSSVNSSGQFIWDQDGSVEIRLVPSDQPVVRVLGNSPGCFPAGDQIPADTVFFAHDDLEVHTTVNCSAPPSPAAPFKNVYDLLLMFPDYSIEVEAPLAIPQFGFPAGERLTLFRIDLDLGAVLAIEYSKSARATEFGGTETKFFEFLIDAIIGCGGTLFAGPATDPFAPYPGNFGAVLWDFQGGFNYGDPNSITSTGCRVRAAEIPFGTGVNQIDMTKGISSLIHTVFNSAFSLSLQAKIFLGGLDVDFYKIGFADIPTSIVPLSRSDSEQGTPSDPGHGTPDFLILAGRFDGQIDFAMLFNLLGGLTAPGEVPQMNTYVGVTTLGPSGQNLKPSADYGRVVLTPRQSYEAGFGRGEAVLAIAADMNQVSTPEFQQYVSFSYRIDGGFWRPYRPGDRIRVPYLSSGRHVLELKARGPEFLVDDTPAEVVFFVDEATPNLRLFAADDTYIDASEPGVVGTSGVYVIAEDNVSVPEAMVVEYRIGEGAWRDVIDGFVPLDAIAGRGPQSLQVRVVDEFDNVTEVRVQVEYVADNTGFGCSTTGGEPRAWAILLLTLSLGWMRVRRRVLKGAV